MKNLFDYRQMRTLLDESLRKELQSELPGNKVRTVQESAGRANLASGEVKELLYTEVLGKEHTGMSRRPRKNHGAAFKAKVALAAIKGSQR